MNISFIGLGLIGYPIAGHLANAGHKLTVFNRTLNKAQAWLKQYRGQIATSLAEIALGAEALYTCVLDDDALSNVLLDSGILPSLKPGTLVIDHSTVSREISQKIGKIAAENKIGFLDAPVSGGKIAADAGKLTIMAGGDRTYYDQACRLFHHYATCYEWMGPTGSGCLAKMANQICGIGALQGVAESIKFIEAAGLDGARLLKLMVQGSAQSRQLEQRGPRMLNKDFKTQASIKIGLKDLEICLAEAKKLGIHLPGTQVSQLLFQQLVNAGMQDQDIAGLIAALK